MSSMVRSISSISAVISGQKAGSTALLAIALMERRQPRLMLDEFDQIYVQGVETFHLSFGFVDLNSNLGETLSFIGITPRALEAVCGGSHLTWGRSLP